MVKTFFDNHKKGCLLTAAVLGSLLFAVYLYILFLPGLNHWDAFLFKQTDGSFSGNGKYASYQVNIERTNNNATITFAVNDIVHEYQVTGTTTGEDVYIYEDGKHIFHGHTVHTGDSYMLVGEDDYQANRILIFSDNAGPALEDLFPTNSWLYAHACSDDVDTFGYPYMLIIIFILIAILVLDIKYPKMFFYLRYSHMVDGGEPSEWYYTSQMIGRVIIVIAIPVCMWMSLFSTF